MKTLLRYLLINLISLWITTEIINGLQYSGGLRTLLLGALVFTIINILLVPLLRILLLPLNLLTLGFFAWLTNVLVLFLLTSLVPQFKILPFRFTGFEYQGFTVPSTELSTFAVAVVASFLIGALTHFLHWLVH